MGEETVNPQVDEVAQEPIQDHVSVETTEQEQPVKEQHVPLSALQKERRKRQEIEMENKFLKEQQQKSQEVDNSQYESVTKHDLGNYEHQLLRKIEEKNWIKNNPEKYEKVNELLPEFLQKRPNLAAAIDASTNRYEEAWELMEKLSPKQQQQLKAPAPKKEAPGSPSGVSKAASLNQAVDVMSMTDSEYLSWRNAQKKRR
jgi:hypothetical protein